MSMSWDKVKEFWDYIEYYPEEDEPGFDGIHYGGIKGLNENAPDSAKKAFAKYIEIMKAAQEKGQKI